MVNVTNGHVTTNISKGAYEILYKHLGFKIVGKPKPKSIDVPVQNEEAPAVDDVVDEVVEDVVEDDVDDGIEELLEKPLSKWTKADIKSFASANDIDISNTKSANEAKAVIKQFMEDADRELAGV